MILVFLSDELIWLTTLIDFIDFGFPLEFDRTYTLSFIEDNHPSINKCSDDIHRYITSELSFKAMMGPFKFFLLNNYTAPFLTRGKAGFSVSRTILDLSWSQNMSVNYGIVNITTLVGTDFTLHYPFIHVFVDDPGNTDMLGVRHKD